MSRPNATKVFLQEACLHMTAHLDKLGLIVAKLLFIHDKKRAWAEFEINNEPYRASIYTMRPGATLLAYGLQAGQEQVDAPEIEWQEECCDSSTKADFIGYQFAEQVFYYRYLPFEGFNDLYGRYTTPKVTPMRFDLEFADPVGIHCITAEEAYRLEKARNYDHSSPLTQWYLRDKCLHCMIPLSQLNTWNKLDDAGREAEIKKLTFLPYR